MQEVISGINIINNKTKSLMQSYQSVMQTNTIRDYVYSSETKRKDQFTLKNILGVDAQFKKNNFVSQNSERLIRTAPRPHTMHSERLKIKFFGDKKGKNMTEAKMQHHGSARNIHRPHTTAAKKQTNHQDKLKMKKALGKINLLAEGNTLDFNQQQEIETIFQFLNCLANTDNHYQQAFSYLCDRLKGLVYADNASNFGQHVKQITKFTDNQILLNFIYRPLGRTTYQSLCSQLLKISSKINTQMQIIKQQSNRDGQNLSTIIKEKQQTILRLKKQLKYYSEHPSHDLYPHIKKLESQQHESQVQIQQLTKLNDENQYKIQIFQNTNMLLSEQIQTLKAKIYEFQLAELSNAKEVEKSSELREFEKNIETLQDMLEKSKLKMQGMKEEFDKVKTYNQQLINQRSVLAKRAAVGYAELTPRPKYIQILSDNGLTVDQFVQISKEKPTTVQLFESMAEVVKLVPKQQIKAYFKKKPKEKVEEKQITKQVMGQLKKTKQQIITTKVSAQNVKKQYNRRMNQRQLLQKAQPRK